MRPQCRVNSTEKLVKFRSTFAGAEDVGVIVDDLGFVIIHLIQNLFAFDHANFTVVSPC